MNIKKFIVSLLLLLLLGCASSIAEQQSLVIDLTFMCEDGNQKACDRLPKEVKVLKGYLE